MSRVGVLGQMSEIRDHLYLSGAGVLQPEKIRQRRISLVVNATTEEPNTYLTGVDCIKVRVDDHPSARIHEHFDVIADKIRSTKERGGRTLVHCMAGVSRSASLVMVYLVKHENMSLRQAYHYVKAARPVIRPNVGFWRQMCEFEKRVRGSNSVQMVQTAECDLPIPDVYCDELRRLRPASIPSKPRAFSASTLRSSMTTPLRRSHSPSLPSSSLALSTSHSLFSPAPSRKSRQSVFSYYSSPRHTFFSAF